jgi:hypothetical protein
MSKKYIIFTYILNKTYIYQVHFLKIIDKKKKKKLLNHIDGGKTGISVPFFTTCLTCQS